MRNDVPGVGRRRSRADVLPFRTADAGQFDEVVARNNVPVAREVLDVVDTPTFNTLEHLLDAVSKSYR